MTATTSRIFLLAALVPWFLGAAGGSASPASSADVKLEIQRKVKESSNFHQTVKQVDALLRSYRSLVQAEGGEREELDGLEAKYNRWKWYWQDRTLPNGDYPDVGAIYRKILDDRKRSSGPGSLRATVPASWTNINQTTAAGGYDGMGRTTDVAFHPTDSNTFFVGSPRGGVWKTTNGGASYQPISEGLPFVSISNIVLEPGDPDTIYVALGDHVWYGPPSAGIYKTTDGGATWNPTSLAFGYASGIRVYDLILHPTVAGTLYAATSDGLYKTVDGFASFVRVFDADTSDVAFRPGTPTVLYLASRSWGSSEIWKSTDGGATWIEKSTLTSGYASMRLSTTPADPAMLGVLLGDGRFFKSTDSGESYSGGVNIGGGGEVVISATDPDTIYGGFVNVYRSTDGGGSWAQFTLWYGGDPLLDEVHADQRNAEVNPLKPDSIYWCNDGGLYEYDEASDTWLDHSDGLIVTQYYRIANSQSNPIVVTGGTQDNGGRLRRENGLWVATNGGDGMEVAIDPLDADVLYTSYAAGLLYRSLDGWRSDVYHSISANIPGSASGEWVTPFELDPQSPNTIVAAYDRVWRSTDRGDSWTAISGALAGGALLDHLVLAPTDGSTIYVAESGATGDPYGTAVGSAIYGTTDLGALWTPAAALPTVERITGIEVGAAGPQVLYATVGGYTAGQKAFVSVDGGQTWSNVSGSLPNVPANDVRAVPDSSNSIYVATDVGVYYRDDSLGDWELYGPGLPMVSVVDIDFQHSGELVRIGTHGRGMYEAPLHRLAASGYCVPQHTSCCNESIGSVSLGSMFHASQGPTSIVITGYSNFTSSVAELAAGSTSTLEVVPDFSFPDSKLGAWVDWNRNGTFEVDERVLDAAGVGPWSGPLHVPVATTPGPTTLRVRLQYGPAYEPDPCGHSGYANGETEDYTVDVLAPLGPPPAPDGDGATSPLLAARLTPDGSRLAIDWDATSCTAGDYNLLIGALGTVGSYAPFSAECGLGTSGSFVWDPVPAGDVWFLLVGSDGVDVESSWGFDGAGADRAGSTPSGLCGATARTNSGTCP